MTQTSYALLVILSLFIMSVLTRSLPFIFSHYLKNNQGIQRIGRHLPAYIMLLLVIYEVGVNKFVVYPYALPAIIALALLTLMHLWKRNMLLSVAVGTLSYTLILYTSIT